MPTTAETVRTYFEAVGRQDLKTMGEIWGDHKPSRIVGLVELTAPDEVTEWFAGIFQAFPDFTMKIEQIVTEGNTAVVRWSATATFNGTGNFEGFKPNGSAIDIEGMDILEVEDGRIHSLVAVLNGLDLARQIGAVPPAGSAPTRR
ncbi:MAG: ester cyclase [Solirubrobacterales bacterium]|nr:ester cyclase [Solirubrobacterales bacterium]